MDKKLAEELLKDLPLCRFDNTEAENKAIQRQALYLTNIIKQQEHIPQLK